MIGGAIAAGELIELKPPLRAALPDLVRVHGRARAPGVGAGRGAGARGRRARDLPRALGAHLGRGSARPSSPSASSRAWPPCSCTTAWPTRSARRRRPKLLFALALAALAPIVIAEIARMVRERSIDDLRARTHGRRRARHQRDAHGDQRDRASTAAAAWACGVRRCSPSRCSRRGTRTSTSRSSAAPTTRRSARSAPHRSSAAWCATVTPSASPTSRSRWAARWASRATSSRSSRPRRCCTTSARCASTSPTTVDRRSRCRSRRRARPSSAARSCSRPPATSSPPSGCPTARTCRRDRR